MSDDEQAIRDLISTWVQATGEGDLNRLVSLMSQDVVFMRPGAPPMGIKDFVTGFNKMQVEVTPVEIHASGDMAYAIVLIKAGEMFGHSLGVYHKQANAQWVLVRDANLLVKT